MAVALAPFAVLLKPVAAALPPFAKLIWPVAVAKAPFAKLFWPVAVALLPFAVLLKPVAVALSPFAWLLAPVAVAVAPFAKLLVPVAVAESPIASLFKPVAVAAAPLANALPPKALLLAPSALAPVPTAVALAPSALAWQAALDSRLVSATLPELHPPKAGAAPSVAATPAAAARLRSVPPPMALPASSRARRLIVAGAGARDIENVRVIARPPGRLPLERHAEAADMLGAPATAEAAGDIDRNARSAEPVLEGETDAALTAIEAAVEREGRASRRRRRRRLGDRRRGRDPAPRLRADGLDAARQCADLRAEAGDVLRTGNWRLPGCRRRRW